MQVCSKCDVHFNNYNTHKKSAEHRKDNIKFIFTKILKLVKPYADDNLVENSISRNETNDVIVYNENIGFALIVYVDFCPIEKLDDRYCLNFIYIILEQRGKGHEKFILEQFKIILHSIISSLGFFDRIIKDWKIERIKTYVSDTSFISSNMDVNCEPILNRCLGGCCQEFSGYKRYVCPKDSTKFTMEYVDPNLF